MAVPAGLNLIIKLNSLPNFKMQRKGEREKPSPQEYHVTSTISGRGRARRERGSLDVVTRGLSLSLERSVDRNRFGDARVPLA